MQKFRNIFLQNRGIKQTMLKNAFWLSISQVSRLLRTITLLYSARILGATEYGTFSYILGVIGIFSIFSDLGINSLITRDTASDHIRQGEYFATSFWLKTSLVVLTSILFLIFAPYTIKVPLANQFVVLGALLILFDNIRDFIIAYLRGLEKMERETLIVTILNISLTALGFFVLVFRPTARDFFLIYTASSFIATLAAFYIARDVILRASSNFRNSIVKEIFENGWPIAIAGIFALIMSNVDIFILGIYRTTGEIGLYSAGQKIVQVLYLLPTLLASAVFPALAYIIKSKDRMQEKNLNEKSIGTVLLFTIPLVVGGIILADPLFKLLFGHEYTPGIYAFMVLLVSTLLMFPGLMLANLVLAHNAQKRLLGFAISSSVINVILDLALIPAWGIMGAAIASFIAQIINYGFMWHKMKKINDFKVLDKMRKIGIASLLMGALTFLLQRLEVPVLFNILISALVYFALLYKMKENLLSEIENFLKHGAREEMHS